MTFGSHILGLSNSQFTLQPEEELQFAKFLVNHATDAVFCLGSDAQFLYVNDGVCRLLGYSCEELLSLNLRDVEPDFLAEIWSEQWRTLKQQGSLTFESRYRAKTGQIFPVEITFSYVEYGGMQFSCAFAREQVNEALECRLQERTAELSDTNQQLCQEISELQRAKAELEQSLSLLRATFAHKFRNPLNTISLSTSLLRRHGHKWTEEEKQPYLECIQTAAEQLGQLLEQVELLVGQKPEN